MPPGSTTVGRMSSTPEHRFGLEASTGPDELQALPPLRASRFPRWAVLLVGLLALALAAGGAAYGAWRYNASKPQVVITAGGPHTPFPMVPPLRVGDYSRDVNQDATPTPNPLTKSSTIASTYAKGGHNAFVLLMSRPEADGKKFMADMGMNAVVPTDDGWCGTSVDSTREGCAVVRDNTALLLVDLSGMTRTDLIEQAHAVAEALGAA